MLHAFALKPASCARFAESVRNQFFGSFSSPCPQCFSSASARSFALTSPLHRGPDVVPPEGDLHWPPCYAVFCREGRKTGPNSRAQKKTMKTNTNKNQNRKSEAQSRPEQLSTSTGNRPKINLELRRANRALETEKLLAVLRSETPNFFELAEVVGKWVWIQFSDKQPPTDTRVLAELGFHWNNTRQTWQHPCGTALFEAATYDPRRRYGSYFAADVKPA
jgi:hypothetical protein